MPRHKSTPINAWQQVDAWAEVAQQSKHRLPPRLPQDKDLQDLCIFYGVKTERTAEARANEDVAAGLIEFGGVVKDAVTGKAVKVWRPIAATKKPARFDKRLAR